MIEITEETVKQAIEEFLDAQQHQPCVLGTVTSEAMPMVHGMHYVAVGSTIYMSCLPNTNKLKNIEDNGNVAYTVYYLAGFDNRFDSRTLQVEGKASVVEDKDEIEMVHNLILEKHSFAKELNQGKNKIIKVVPRRALWSDFSKGPKARQYVQYK